MGGVTSLNPIYPVWGPYKPTNSYLRNAACSQRLVLLIFQVQPGSAQAFGVAKWRTHNPCLPCGMHTVVILQVHAKRMPQPTETTRHPQLHKPACHRSFHVIFHVLFQSIFRNWGHIVLQRSPGKATTFPRVPKNCLGLLNLKKIQAFRI